jgi:hypothetical protein
LTTPRRSFEVRPPITDWYGGVHLRLGRRFHPGVKLIRRFPAPTSGKSIMTLNSTPRGGSANEVLAGLGAGDFSLLEPHLAVAELRVPKQLELPNKRIDYVYFIDSGFASVAANGSTRTMQKIETIAIADKIAESLIDTFPASDPPAWIPLARVGTPKRPVRSRPARKI